MNPDRPSSVNKDQLAVPGGQQCNCGVGSSRSPPSLQQTGDPWVKCAKQLREHDEDTTKRWKEEIDSLLVFAGLFSGVLTAFIVEFYDSLTPSSSPTTEDVLYQISVYLASLGAGNITGPTPNPVSPGSTRTEPASIWINSLWFSSLALSLSTASIGIVVQQWLNHFISPTSSNPQRSAHLHCLRYDKGLISWSVPAIMSALPILIQVALGLFLSGLVILLWSLNNIVASITTFLVGSLLIFTIFTTVAPAFRPECPYKSPPALLFLWLMQRISSIFLFRLIRRLVVGKSGATSSSSSADEFFLDIPNSLDSIPEADGVSLSQHIIDSLGLSPESLLGRLLGGNYLRPVFLRNLRQRVTEYVGYPEDGAVPATWRAQEHSLLTSGGGSLMYWIETNVLTCADAVLLEDSFLDTVVRPCIFGPDAGIQAVRKCLHARIRNKRPLTLEGGRTLEQMSIELAPRIAANGDEAHARSFLQDMCKQIARSPHADLAVKAITSCAHLCSVKFSFSFREGVAALLTNMTQNLISKERWPPSPDQDSTAHPCLPHHDNIRFLLEYARVQISASQIAGNPDPDRSLECSLISCCVSLHLVGLLPNMCYRQYFRIHVFALVNAVFKASGSRSRRRVLIGRFWGTFFNDIITVARRCGDPELINRMRTEPGYVQYISAHRIT
ncbi:hypothetical protein OBBRIDRAFT_760220 [Obba rivulosa]|uniref:DUF6535 domain-containing protein n=1 Tax=Obba rivulosa TaxID=1052685 RepID=A0A8E2DHL4_9APHY|nr:hypothetical protein OBBRIDRAFT_760220 [Obba rivulosa]